MALDNGKRTENGPELPGARIGSRMRVDSFWRINQMKGRIAIIATLAFYSMVFQAMATDTGPLPLPLITRNSVEVCLNSRYSQHSLGRDCQYPADQ